MGKEDKELTYGERVAADKMTIKSRDLGGGKYEVCGVIFYAKSHLKAIQKWLRKKDGKN